MVNYTTNLDTWGATGSSPPLGYAYEEGEQPVDDWDNFINHNVISDIDHLIDTTNNDLLAKDGSVDLAGDLSSDTGTVIWDYSSDAVPNTALANDNITVTGGNALTGGTASLGGSLTVGVDSDAIQTDELDLSISPTWTSTHQFSSGIQIDEGSSIRDDGGGIRVGINPDATFIRGGGGINKIVANSGAKTEIRTYSGEPFIIDDREGAGTAVQYDTDASVGELRTPNAGFRVEARTSFATGQGLEITHDGVGRIISRDSDTGNRQVLQLQASELEMGSSSGLIDFTLGGSFPADLRLATGQSIEDGSGTIRVNLLSAATDIKNNGGDTAITLNDTNQHSIWAYSDTPVTIEDKEGVFTAVQYTTSASAPGTLELTSANLDVSGNVITGINRGYFNAVDQLNVKTSSVGSGKIGVSDGTRSGFGDGDWVIGSQDTAGSGDKHAVLFDYSAGTVSSERYKKDVRTLEADPYGILDVDAITYTSRDSNEKTAHGFLAEDLAEWDEKAVKWSELSEDWAHDDYTEKYGYEVGDEVPNQPREWPVIAGHHEIIKDLVARIEELEAQVAT